MNRKLITLVVTVLLALAITAPALAEVVVFNWEEEGPADTPCGDDIWLKIRYHWQVRYEYDENGDLVEIIYQTADQWYLYNKSYPELFIRGSTGGSGHFIERNGEWGTGLSINFHAPGYPQIAHFSGYWTFDDDGNPTLEHGRLEDVNVDVFCELLTP